MLQFSDYKNKLKDGPNDLLVIYAAGLFGKLTLEAFKEKNIKVSLIDKYGFNGDLIESQMFAYLAVRSIKKLPISIPSTTGVNHPISGGILYK